MTAPVQEGSPALVPQAADDALFRDDQQAVAEAAQARAFQLGVAAAVGLKEATTGDTWGMDPLCYLTDAEVAQGVSAALTGSEQGAH